MVGGSSANAEKEAGGTVREEGGVSDPVRSDPKGPKTPDPDRSTVKGRKPQPYDGDEEFKALVADFPVSRRAGLPKAHRLWKALTSMDQFHAREGAAKEFYERRDAKPPTLEFMANVTKWLAERRWERLE